MGDEFGPSSLWCLPLPPSLPRFCLQPTPSHNSSSTPCVVREDGFSFLLSPFYKRPQRIPPVLSLPSLPPFSCFPSMFNPSSSVDPRWHNAPSIWLMFLNVRLNTRTPVKAHRSPGRKAFIIYTERRGSGRRRRRERERGSSRQQHISLISRGIFHLVEMFHNARCF